MKMKSVWRIMEGLTGSFFCNEDEVCMENHGRPDGFIFFAMKRKFISNIIQSMICILFFNSEGLS